MLRVAVIGTGFSGLSAAAYLSKSGYEVHVFEKNALPGGRSRQMRTDNGYMFDMGPSWYWMPSVFENFFNDFGYNASDFYELKLLNPSFEIVFGKNNYLSVPSDFNELCNLFDAIEPNSSVQLKLFMEEAALKYEFGVENLVYKPSLSIFEFLSFNVIKNALKMDLFSSFRKHVRKYFKHPKLISLMEFPVLFLGAMPNSTPALYSLMNYAGLKLGTWYPANGGFSKVVDAMKKVAEANGTKFHFNSTVSKIITENKKATGIIVNNKILHFDGVIASADYHHVEQTLLPEQLSNYNENYWNKKTFAPSALIYYLGINKKISRLQHHTLFFEEDLDQHAIEIYEEPQWPSNPLFYVCCTSKSDETVAPKGHENIFMLMPISTQLSVDDEATREKYFSIMIKRLQDFIGEDISENIDYKKSYCLTNFIQDYNSYKGNAYGLANTLNQTAVLKPRIKNNHINNLFYAGQLTVPGPGVPPAIISGKVSAQLLNKHLKK